MKNVFLICFLSISCLTFNIARAEVRVLTAEQQQVFQNGVRLIEVLAPHANQQPWYWPASALYEIDDGELDSARQELLTLMSQLGQSKKKHDPELAFALEKLAVDITEWTLARRMPLVIDYDLSRLKAAANPQFSQKQYILKLALRSNTVYIFGAINGSQKIAHLAHADVSEYKHKLLMTDAADRDYVTIIQADGRIIKAPVAYWNKSHQEVMPGSQIYVPFSESIFNPEFRQINQQIVKLAVNRVW